MSELDVNNLLNALENESNASIMNLTSKNKIHEKQYFTKITIRS